MYSLLLLSWNVLDSGDHIGVWRLGRSRLGFGFDPIGRISPFLVSGRWSGTGGLSNV